MSEKGTEKATPQRKEQAKKKGDSVRSRELLSAVSLLAGVLVLGAMTRGFVTSWSRVFVETLRSAAIGMDDEAAFNHALRTMLAPAMVPVGTVMAASFAGALLVGIAQGGGLSIHPNALELKFNRLNPATNFANIMSLRSATRLVKSLVPAAVMVLFGWAALKALMLPMPVMRSRLSDGEKGSSQAQARPHAAHARARPVPGHGYRLASTSVTRTQ